MKFVEKKVRELTEKTVEDLGYDLVDLKFVNENGRNFLRYFIGKKGGISIDDCELVSTHVSDVLDAEDPIKGAYYLEVSSPGLDRPLETDKDFERNLGEEVEIGFYMPVEGAKTHKGRFVDYTDETVTIMVGEEEKQFNKKDVSVIKLAINI